jgi:hypothetical protein
MRVAVVLLTWQRIANLKLSLTMLDRQTNKNFDVYISNGNLRGSAIQVIEKHVNFFRQRGMSIVVSNDGNDLYTFRRFTVGNKLAREGYDVVMFLDDDVSFPSGYVQECLNQYVPKTYQSGFAWSFYKRGHSYYKFRTRVWNNEKEIHYCGTGFSMIDASIFLEEGLLNAPPESYKIEDLWLSYYAKHILGWDLRYMTCSDVVLRGADKVALFKQVQQDPVNKEDFLRQLVELGWKLPD